MKQKIDWRVLCVGLICVTAAEIVAILQGMNGTVFSLYLVVIGGAIGVALPIKLKK